jgi:hypothetical protein
MTLFQKRLPFKVARKPKQKQAGPIAPALPPRESLRSFIGPEVWVLIESPPAIVHPKRRTA